MIHERRRSARVSLKVDVGVSTGSNFYAGKTRDISVGGLFVELPLAPAAGTEVGISLHLGSQQFALTARSTWVLSDADGAPIGFGAEFVDLLPRAKFAINAFMQKRDPMAFDLIEDDAGDAPKPHHAKGPPPLPH